MKIRITNHFTNLSTVVDASLPMTTKKADSIRSRLCLQDCYSGDDLGASGPQVEGYSDLLYRAQCAIMSGGIR